MAAGFETGQIFDSLRQTLRHLLSYYIRQVDTFNEKWSGLCPVIAKSDLNKSISTIVSTIDQESIADEFDTIASCFHLIMVLLINDLSDNSSVMATEGRQRYLSLVDMILPSLVAKADIPSIQGLILLSLYIQISGQILSMPQINGLLVQTSQMSGLHRHSRRFKFSAGQIEIRKRMWWWIYIFDK